MATSSKTLAWLAWRAVDKEDKFVPHTTHVEKLVNASEAGERLVFKAHSLLYRPTLGLRVITKKREAGLGAHSANAASCPTTTVKPGRKDQIDQSKICDSTCKQPDIRDAVHLFDLIHTRCQKDSSLRINRFGPARARTLRTRLPARLPP